jgi:putative oxygen-independent coproporphyrinogen III oxidase
MPLRTARTEPVPHRGQKDPIGIYIHWPFCQQKCPYCDFNSHVRFEGWDEDKFVEAYRRELTWFHGDLEGRSVASVFFGGGTPSLMRPSTVGSILDHIAELWPVDEKAEVTLEANPGSVEAGRFAGYREAGVNRVSIGVQSLYDADLKSLGRIHSSAEAKAAVALADKIFDRFSFDLIYARPHQTLKAWREELGEALQMAGGHLSLYQLTIEDGTPFAELYARGRLQIPASDEALALYDLTQELTEQAGLPAYEISNHARLGEESRHNLIYWRYGVYVGCGPGAHGRLPRGDHRCATVGRAAPEAWCEAVSHHGHGLNEVTEIDCEAMADECLLMGLRLREGLHLDRLTSLTGYALQRSVIDDLVALGFVEFCPESGFSAMDADGDEADQGLKAPRPVGIGQRVVPLAPSGPADAGASDLVTTGSLRVTPRGRFVLNQIVYQLSSKLKAVSVESV